MANGDHEMKQPSGEQSGNVIEVFLAFLRLGLTSFGGPIAHLGFFRDEFVRKRKWVNDHAYADLVALCQFLPGPASSQVGIALGLSRAGIPGAVAAWLGFTLPSAIALVLFALSLSGFAGDLGGGWLHGLKVVAVAVVAQALWGMGKSLCPDRSRATIAVAAAAMTALIPSAAAQILVILAGGIIGWLYLRHSSDLPHTPIKLELGKLAGAVSLVIFAALLIGLPLAAKFTGSHGIHLVDSFFRAGSLVFGGGHVVLPLLQSEVVPPGWVSKDAFMAGYGAAQAVPGPLFTFTAYLGAVSRIAPNRWLGAIVCLVSAFLPSFLLVAGALPFWEQFRRHASMRNAMLGINAAVVGLLLSAFYNPVWTSAINNRNDFSLALGAFLLLVFWKIPPWLVVILSAAAGGLIR